MTTTPPEAESGPRPEGDGGPRVTASQARDLSRLHRTTGPWRRVGGVAGGLARHLDVDPLLLRVAFVVLALFGGAGLLVYVALWLLVPEDGSERATVSLSPQQREVALLVSLAVGGVIVLEQVLGNGLGVGWPLAVIAAVVGLVLYLRRDQPRPGAYPTRTPPPGTPYDRPPHAGAPAARTATGGSVAGPGWLGAPPPAGTGDTAQQAWASYAATAVPRPPHVPDPRKRGPRLFGFAVATILLGFGVLGLVDVNGTAVPAAAYPALAVAVTGAALVLSAVWGRGGGLIALGLVATLALAATSAASTIDSDPQTVRPTALPTDSTYSFGAGDHTVDLTAMTPEQLEGESVYVESGAGRVTLIVPDGLTVDAQVEVGLGEAEVFGETRSGPGLSFQTSGPGRQDLPHLFAQVQLGAGRVQIITEGEAR